MGDEPREPLEKVTTPPPAAYPTGAEAAALKRKLVVCRVGGAVLILLGGAVLYYGADNADAVLRQLRYGGYETTEDAGNMLSAMMYGGVGEP